MKNKNFALITSAGGHGFMELNFGKLRNQEIIACSEKGDKEEFDKETADIDERFSPFISNMKIATWEECSNVLKNGVSYRKKLLDGEFRDNDWNDFAKTTLSLQENENLPEFEGVNSASFIVMLTPQKLITDGKCGLSVEQQTIPLEVFNFFKSDTASTYLLGQHFNKVDDWDLVKNVARDFDMYIPGEKEYNHILGIRGVGHNQLFNMYKKVDMSVGVASTNTWYMLTCFPEKPQIIFYNKNGMEDWEKIAKAYQKQGYLIYTKGFDEKTDWKKFALETKALYTKLSKRIKKEKMQNKQVKPMMIERQYCKQ